MPTVACPGCGLPRVKDQIASTPCPLCHAAPAPSPRTPSVDRPVAPDPTADLPADASELERYAPPSRSTNRMRRLIVPAAFVAGIATGVLGLLSWQSAFERNPQPQSSPFEQTAAIAAHSPLPRPDFGFPMAPMPHLPHSPAPASLIDSVLAPQSSKKSLLPAQAIVIDLNQPEAVYTVPSTMQKGEHLIIRGKVKTLRAFEMASGATLDASGLDAGSVFIGGKVDGRSTLKLNAPNGAVTIAAWIDDHSQIEINAPGGNVRFSPPTTPNSPGAQINGGATVALSARVVELRGRVDGTDTKVGVSLPPGGVLKVAAVLGSAIVEYSVQPGTGVAPDVTVGTVAPTAFLKRRN
jgi:hypothetical protein